MCATCGCGRSEDTHQHADGTVHSHRHDHAHGHDHEGRHSHPHDHGHDRQSETIRLEREVLERNDRLAERNRGFFAARRVLALNLVSSPGAGKTTLLERTIRDAGRDLAIEVIEGDQETSADADRIRAAGAHAVQINTGTGCHLDAAMISAAFPRLELLPRSTLLIENVGNLVCPALFDLGERAKVVVASVTEGEDKPLKYPHMFRASAALVLNKIDLLPHVQFDVDRFLANARQINPRQTVFRVSATRGDGLADWYGWLAEQRAAG
jgi:hydrogenase nickel incorporation protein HypB